MREKLGGNFGSSVLAALRSLRFLRLIALLLSRMFFAVDPFWLT